MVAAVEDAPKSGKERGDRVLVALLAEANPYRASRARHAQHRRDDGRRLARAGRARAARRYPNALEIERGNELVAADTREGAVRDVRRARCLASISDRHVGKLSVDPIAQGAEPGVAGRPSQRMARSEAEPQRRQG